MVHYVALTNVLVNVRLRRYKFKSEPCCENKRRCKGEASWHKPRINKSCEKYSYAWQKPCTEVTFLTGRIAAHLAETISVQALNQFLPGEKWPFCEKDLSGVSLEDLPCFSQEWIFIHSVRPPAPPVWSGRGAKQLCISLDQAPSG